MSETPAFALETREGAQCLVARGDWTTRTIAAIDPGLRRILAEGGPPPTQVDVSELGAFDTAGAWLMCRAIGAGIQAQIVGSHPFAERLLGEVARHNTAGSAAPLASPDGLLQVLERLGRGLAEFAEEVRDTLAFVGRTLVAFWRAARHPRRIRWLPVFAVAESAGFNAIPIVVVLSFFIGAVIAFLGTTILARFGTQVFTIELVGFAVLREFGALITAIILAGRSDSAFTAQIGSMKMTQELDAMRILGLDPFDMLVMPRVIALLVMTPILTFFAMLAGLAGGWIVTLAQLDLSPVLFFSRLQENVGIDQFWAGMAKAPVFAFAIAIIGCRHGLLVENDVISLGRRTTASVVQALFAVIVIEALFALFYMELDI